MKWYAGILLVLTLVLNARIWVSDDGLSEVWRLEQAVAAQQSTNASLVRRNDQLAAEVTDLKGGLVAVEERARSELGMIGPNETFYQVVAKTTPSSPSASPSLEPAPVPQGAPAGAERTRTAQR